MDDNGLQFNEIDFVMNEEAFRNSEHRLIVTWTTWPNRTE